MKHDSSTNNLIRRYRKAQGGMHEDHSAVYDKPLYILPFDHRGSFETGMFGWKGELTPIKRRRLPPPSRSSSTASRPAVADGVPKQKAGILVDEQFGAAILRDAASQGIHTSLPCGEKRTRGVRLRVWRRFCGAHRGVSSHVLQGAGALQPRGRCGDLNRGRRAV